MVDNLLCCTYYSDRGRLILEAEKGVFLSRHMYSLEDDIEGEIGTETIV